ncbi:uncharacterized protein LOC113003080 [Solenopsis invicta]|uniref:uncharacterized protein LOC113003080 n=1 Tax=Solenopsis invicta TaxID=13686 RepID=UPI00193E6B77|nr:uncharacterized protein LOC113003080 [Solenopsis invicta]
MEEKNNVLVNSTPSIEYTLRPITYISWLLGAGVARPRNYSKAITIIKQIVYLIVCITNMVIVGRDVFIYGSVFALESNIFEFVYFLNIVTFHVSAYYNVCHGIRQYEKWPELMDKINELDQKIRRQTPINDQPIKNVEALAILTTFAWFPLTTIVYFLYYYFTNPEYIYVFTVLYIYIVTQSLINSFVFDVVVYVLYYRFKTVNKLIRHLNEQNNLNESLFDPSLIALKIRRIREIYTGICHLISTVNDIYRVHLLLCSVNCFITIVTLLFTTYLNVVEKNYTYILLNNIIVMLCATQFGLMCWICTLTRQESDEIGRSVHEIVFYCKPVNRDKLNGAGNHFDLEIRQSFENLDSEQNFNRSCNHNLNYLVLENFLRRYLDRDCIRNEINDFSIQLQQYRVAFSACNFFEVNNALFSGFVGMIITYSIIFIQFYQRPENLDTNLVDHLIKIF